MITVAAPTSDEVLSRDEAVVTRALYRYTDVAFARGEGSALWDYEGRRYIDFAAGIATLSVGHCHPRVVEAIVDQARTLIHGASHIGYMEPYVALLEKLRSIAPGSLHEGKGILLNSGSEAVEAAVKLARMVTGRSMVLAFTGGFHGRPMGALALTASSAGYRRGLESLLGGVEHVPYPTCRRCAFGNKDRDTTSCCNSWQAMIELTLSKLVHPDDLAAVVVEPVLGEGGYYIPPADFLPYLRALCDRTGALLITDEVQTGLGRTGRWYAAEHWNVVPDVVALGKAIGGGLPLGGVLARADLMERWATAAHGSTFGGNPVACRAGLASLEIIEEDGLVARAETMGRRIQERIRAASVPVVGDVRGLGMMIAVELVDEQGAVLPGPEVDALVKRIGRAGVVMTKCGQQLLRIAPPLNIDEADADRAVDIVVDVLQSYSRERRHGGGG